MGDFIDRNTLLEMLIGVIGSSRVDQLISKSDGYVGSFTQGGLSVGDTTYFVLKTGPVDVGLEEILTVTDFSTVESGRMITNLEMYTADSNINTWSYGAGGVNLPVGRNLNTKNINKSPQSELLINPADVLVSGQPDFELQFAEYFVDTQGNRETLSTNYETFFSGGKKIIIPANSEFLFVSTVTGDALGTATNRSIFFTSEFTEDA